MAVTITSYPLNEISYSISTPDTTYSNEIVKYLWIDISEAPNDKYIEIVYNGITKTLLITDECRYTPIDVSYLNKEGAIQILTFFKVKRDSISIKKEKFEGNRGHGFHQFVNFNVVGNSKFEVNSGFVSEDRNENIKQLLLSERVWLLDNGVEIPLTVGTSSQEFKTRQNDRLINYKIDFDYAFNDINNI
jgi:hypothetical protein